MLDFQCFSKDSLASTIKPWKPGIGAQKPETDCHKPSGLNLISQTEWHENLALVVQKIQSQLIFWFFRMHHAEQFGVSHIKKMGAKYRCFLAQYRALLDDMHATADKSKWVVLLLGNHSTFNN
jgi:hypothetical protein